MSGDSYRGSDLVREELGEKLAETYTQTWDNVLDTALLLEKVEARRKRTLLYLRIQTALNVATVAFILVTWKYR